MNKVLEMAALVILVVVVGVLLFQYNEVPDQLRTPYIAVVGSILVAIVLLVVRWKQGAKRKR